MKTRLAVLILTAITLFSFSILSNSKGAIKRDLHKKEIHNNPSHSGFALQDQDQWK